MIIFDFQSWVEFQQNFKLNFTQNVIPMVKFQSPGKIQLCMIYGGVHIIRCCIFQNFQIQLLNIISVAFSASAQLALFHTFLLVIGSANYQDSTVTNDQRNSEQTRINNAVHIVTSPYPTLKKRN
eukprot:TRINITY_DN14840_c0_g1_i1.p5 TRINITY_DN14840_c0_g1~~TRINITY_DN14840_c0_g1_i1.p5  ORF type:complete len:125 (-),score=0.40 TRINITY_DN14840_c0_g1_i1:982-1356(-)